MGTEWKCSRGGMARATSRAFNAHLHVIPAAIALCDSKEHGEAAALGEIAPCGACTTHNAMRTLSMHHAESIYGRAK